MDYFPARSASTSSLRWHGVEENNNTEPPCSRVHSLRSETSTHADLNILTDFSLRFAIEAKAGKTPASVVLEACSVSNRSAAMPSIEEMCVLSAAAPTTATRASSCPSQQDFLARDVEELVSEIKENLRLSSGGLKSRPSFSVLHKSSRPSPYRIPSRSRSWGDPNCDACSKAGAAGARCCGHSCKKSPKVSAEADDPYEMLQELLRDGGLIKEAVRRLSMGLSPKQRYFYDSDEDTRSPIRMCHVEL